MIEITLPCGSTLYTTEKRKAHCINPQAYLNWVLNTITAHPVNRIDDLLPWNFNEAQLDKAA